MRFGTFGTAAATALLLGMFATHVSAQTVTGSLTFGANPTNYYLPANGFVPAGYGNTGGQPVAIGSGIEFGFDDGANRDTADFTGSTLILRDIANGGGNNPWQQIFTVSTPGYFTGATLIQDSLPGGVTFTALGNTLTVNWGGFNGAFDGTATFQLQPTSVPAPAAGAGLPAVLGLLGVWFARRRNRKSAA